MDRAGTATERARQTMVRAITTEGDPAQEPFGASPQRSSFPSIVLRSARPRQWVKNLLVFAAPAAAGQLSHGGPAAHAAGGFAVFCLAASGNYFVNDALDAEADRLHPRKRHRPVASGHLSVPTALAIGLSMVVASVLCGWWLAGGRLALVVGIYGALTAAYSLRLKHEAVLDLAAVAGGFVLRAIAGGLATNVPLSNWFVIVSSFGALFVVAGKRSGEHTDLGERRGEHRPTLAVYPATFLRTVRLLAASVTVTAYCLWAFERSSQVGRGHHPIWFELSIVPFVLAILHVELRFERGLGGAPEELALRDRVLQMVGLVWVVLVVVGIYS